MIIWLASYPRSGNTFLRIILNKVFALKNYSLYNDKSDIAADKKTTEVVGHEQLPDDFDIERARREEKLYIIKTHDYPDNDEDKVIYLVRDGRESALSYLKYLQQYGQPETTLLDVIYGNVFFGNWGQHIKAWNLNFRQDVLLIKFEELVSNPAAYIERIARYTGVAAKGENIPGFSELQAINPKFFRNGKKDSWKQVFSDEQHLAFWMKNYDQMMAYGYCQDIPEAFVNGDQMALIRQLSNENSYLLKHLNKHCDKLLDEKNAAIAEIRVFLSARDQQIAQQRALLASRDSQIAKQHVIIANRDRQIPKLHELISSRDEKIPKLRELISSRDEKIPKLRELISSRDEKIPKLRELISSRDEKIPKLRELISSRDTQLVKQREVLAARDKHIHTTDIELKQLRRKLEMYQQLVMAVEQMRRVGTAPMHPYKKYSIYKEVLAAHDQIKKS